MLDRVLGRLPRQDNPNVLVGFDEADDAGVYRLDEATGLVQTVDFFTPIVDDPELFGQIAAANALSDVYAMGGRPLSALAIACFPGAGDPDILERILRGGLHKMRQAKCAVVGGHSVADDEIKFGYAVTGIVAPENIRANRGAKPGDVLVLTKAIGTGVISTALKRGLASAEHVESMVASMSSLNAAAGQAISDFDVHAATDVTGFGLLGHAREVAVASGVLLDIEAAAVPLLPGALQYARDGAFPGGQKNNRAFAECSVEVGKKVAGELEGLLYDPQTSGGLLIAVAPEAAQPLLEALSREKVPARTIGAVLKGEPGHIRVR